MAASRPPPPSAPPPPPGAGGALLRPVLRLLAASVRGFHAALGSFLFGGLLLAMLATFAFAAVARRIAGGATQEFDDAVLRWMEQHHTEWLDVVALEITSLGSFVVVALIAAVVSVFLWLTRHRYSVLLLWLAVLGSVLLNNTLKAGFERPRPEIFPWRVPYAGHASFPSGHAMTAMAVYGTVAYLVARLEPSAAMRRGTLLAAALLIALIGLSRLYLGVHYPSDVLAGWVVGFAWAAFCAAGLAAVRFLRGRRPQVERQERDLDAPGPVAAERGG